MSTQDFSERTIDRPRSVAALFPSEEAGAAALDRLRAAGIEDAWLGVTQAQHDGAFSEVVHARGGGPLEQFIRKLSGDGDESLSKALIDHGVAEDVARRLIAGMPEHGVVVVAGWTGDITEAARVLEAAGGTLVRGDDAGVIGMPRLRQPGQTP